MALLIAQLEELTNEGPNPNFPVPMEPCVMLAVVEWPSLGLSQGMGTLFPYLGVPLWLHQCWKVD